MVNVATLQSGAQPCSHAWIDDLIANIADMAATSAAKENIYSRKKCFSNALGYTVVVLEVL